MDNLEARRPGLAAKFENIKHAEEKRGKILTNGPYPGIGRSHPDLYKAFSWRFWNLVNTGGKVGIVLPRSCFIGPGMEIFRHQVLDDGEIIDLTFLRNKAGWVFDGVEPRYTIALFTLHRTGNEIDPELPIRGPYDELKSYQRAMGQSPHRFPAERAKQWGGAATMPLLPSDLRSVDVFDILESHSFIGDDSAEWYPVPYQELNATQDKIADDGTRIMHMIEDPPENYWPVYKGESFNLWTPRAGNVYAWADPDVLIDYMQNKRESSYRYAGSRSPFSEMGDEWVKKRETLPCNFPRITFRDITNRTNTRTTIASLIPPKTVVVHNSPTLVWPKGNAEDEAFLLGILSSIPLDWYSRRFVETHLTFGIFNKLPVPRPGRENLLRHRVVQLSGRLAAVDKRYANWADAVGVEYGPLDDNTKQQKIHELDAVVAHLYGLTREHVEVIFETFHTGWDYEERLAAVLDYYDSWAERLGPEHTPQTETSETDD
jgi:hypothetical protein